MINKPMGYDEAIANTGEGYTLPAGNYICKILKAVPIQTMSGAEAIKINFDIDEGEYKGFFGTKYNSQKESGNANAKWGGVFTQITGGKSISFFKGMITAIEQSNNGYTWNWDETTLAGKRFVGQFGREQFIGNDGNAHWATKCRGVRSIGALDGLSVPEDKPLNDGFAEVPLSSYSDERLPWE